jgi:hypothetical protein
MSNYIDEDLTTRKMLETIFNGNKKIILENGDLSTSNDINNTKSGEIPINDTMFPGILENQIETLNQKLPNVTFDDNPFILNKSNDTVTLKGKIQNLNLVFIMTTDTSNGGDGLYVSTQSLNLNDKTLQILNVLYGHAQIFQQEWTINEVQKKLKTNNIKN